MSKYEICTQGLCSFLRYAIACHFRMINQVALIMFWHNKFALQPWCYYCLLETETYDVGGGIHFNTRYHPLIHSCTLQTFRDTLMSLQWMCTLCIWTGKTAEFDDYYNYNGDNKQDDNDDDDKFKIPFSSIEMLMFCSVLTDLNSRHSAV